MSEYIAKISQDGYNVDTCSDDQLLFSSEWPTLQILYEGEFTGPTSITGTTLIFAHNLGYFPAFMVIDKDTGGILLMEAYITRSNLMWGGGNYANKNLHFYIFNWNLETNYLSTIKNINQQIRMDNDEYIISISENGADAISGELKNLVINSSGRTPMIHQSGFGTHPAAGYATISHNLGYIPMFLVYVDEGEIHPGGVTGYYLNRSYKLLSSSGSILSINHISKSELIISGSAIPIKYAYLIFKDPI